MKIIQVVGRWLGKFFREILIIVLICGLIYAVYYHFTNPKIVTQTIYDTAEHVIQQPQAITDILKQAGLS